MRGDREAFGVLVNQTSDRMYAIATGSCATPISRKTPCRAP